jgi:hypothetical protein
MELLQMYIDNESQRHVANFAALYKSVVEATKPARVSQPLVADGWSNLLSLEHSPKEHTERVYLNGVLQMEGRDYMVHPDQKAIIFQETPKQGDLIHAHYTTNIPNIGIGGYNESRMGRRGRS